ncbi:MAG: TIGR00374 family protein [Bacteroidetes bacterium MED-G13]|nr:MAG: TIGR00374 family protein [Bacteroidetes bacterium MED-G13]
MNLKNKLSLKIFLPISIGLFCIYYSFKDINFLDFKELFIGLDYMWILFGLVLGALSHISRSYRWKFLVDPLGYKLGIKNSILSVFAAYLINYTIPRAGDVARASIISNYEKIPFEKLIGTIIAERIVDMICISVLILISLLYEFERISEKIMTLLTSVNFGNLLIFLITVFLIIFLAFRILKRFKFHKKFSNFLTGLKSGLTVIMRMEQKFAFIAHSIFIWLMYVFMFYVTSFAFSDLHGTNFFHLLISFTLAALSIMFSNGGIGIYPLAVEESLYWYGIEAVNGLAFGWVMWLSQTIMVIIFGGLSLFILPFINTSKSRN